MQVRYAAMGPVQSAAVGAFLNVMGPVGTLGQTLITAALAGSHVPVERSVAVVPASCLAATVSPIVGVFAVTLMTTVKIAVDVDIVVMRVKSASKVPVQSAAGRVRPIVEACVVICKVTQLIVVAAKRCAMEGRCAQMGPALPPVAMVFLTAMVNAVISKPIGRIVALVG